MSSRLFVLLILSACGVAPAAPAAPVAPAAPTAAADPVPVTAPGPGEWKTWSHERKLAYMKGPFFEQAKAVFTAFEPARYARFNCRTCHGEGADNQTYKMPNRDLAVLVGGKPGFQELADHEPQLLGFMQQQLVPAVAGLLGVPAFDMKTHVGFSCFDCHTRSDKPDQTPH